MAEGGAIQGRLWPKVNGNPVFSYSCRDVGRKNKDIGDKIYTRVLELIP